MITTLPTGNGQSGGQSPNVDMCWADVMGDNGKSAGACCRGAETEIGLCEIHHQEMVGHAT